MALPPLTVAYLTFRTKPLFGWFAASLMRELRSMPDYNPLDLEVLVIDGRFPRAVRVEGEEELAAPFPFAHHAPKPTVWQGPHRLTTRDYFAAASTRNTVFALAHHAHVAFVDDLSVLLPGWLKAHVHAASHGYVLCGTTCKHRKLVVGPDGEVLEKDDFPPGMDSRMKNLVSDDLMVCTGGWLYGGTFSVPLEHALRINGQDEIHDTIGGEDYDFGIRLERAGSRIYISRTCGTLEDDLAHHTEAPMIRVDKPWPPGTNVRIAGGGEKTLVGIDKLVNGSDGPYSSNRLYNRLIREAGRYTTLGNPFDLRDIRARVQRGEPFPILTEPSTHWVDGQPLSEM